MGGLWNSQDKTPKKFEERHEYLLESIYEEVETNLPWFVMNYKDFPSKGYCKTLPSHFTKKEVEQYLSDYASHFNLHPLIQFNTLVTDS